MSYGSRANSFENLQVFLLSSCSLFVAGWKRIDWYRYPCRRILETNFRFVDYTKVDNGFVINFFVSYSIYFSFFKFLFFNFLFPPFFPFFFFLDFLKDDRNGWCSRNHGYSDASFNCQSREPLETTFSTNQFFKNNIRFVTAIRLFFREFFRDW